MLEKITNALEHVVKKQGDISSFLIYPLLIIVVFEVVMRYALNSPTIWAFEATTFLYGLHYMFGLAYTDVYDGHVKVDIFTSMASDKIQTILRIFTNLVLFMPVIGCMTLWSIKFAYISTMGNELNSTSWAPPLWPFKILMALCFVFLLMQGIANLLKDINTLKTKETNHES